ncbi:hypothetical protein [Oryza sativa Japonica Group]|uniref:Uncharacterized protein n=2 Tax=Oryza sativa subsp. japonica TaxID=39947 RepID=Q5QLK8_ORYSJ|nr:hypothetical protein [Oryza sativa Japonica Group]BAD73700.1 hypothetical protein [Oryza sativa Japonica Group]
MGSLLRVDAVVRGEETACGRRGEEEDANGEGGVGINVEVLGGDIVRHGEGLVQRGPSGWQRRTVEQRKGIEDSPETEKDAVRRMTG